MGSRNNQQTFRDTVVSNPLLSLSSYFSFLARSRNAANGGPPKHFWQNLMLMPVTLETSAVSPTLSRMEPEAEPNSIVDFGFHIVEEPEGDRDFYSSSDIETNSSSDEEDVTGLLHKLMMALLSAMASYFIMLQSFQAIELSRENQISVNPAVPVHDVLSMLQATPERFKEITNFAMEEFLELCTKVVPTIQAHARSTGHRSVVASRPCKLSPEQRLLSFILYMKHDNVIYFDAMLWNWSRLALCDDAIFVASCLNDAIADEIRWPTAEERNRLAQRVSQLPGCIGIVDGTLCRIKRPFEDEHHACWFQGRKKMYCMNSTVIVDHDGLFIFVDPGYPGSYHDVTILRNSWVERNWRDLFTNLGERYYECILGDQGYTEMERFIMRGFSKGEQAAMQFQNVTAIKDFNRMLSGYRVHVEWGIGGLKMKWRRLQKKFDLTKSKFAITFQVAALMTNFLHRRRRNMHSTIEGPRERRAENRGWAGDPQGFALR